MFLFVAHMSLLFFVGLSTSYVFNSKAERVDEIVGVLSGGLSVKDEEK